LTIVAEKYKTLQKITLKHSLPLLVDHKSPSLQTAVRKQTSAGTGNDNRITATSGTLMLKDVREMRFLVFNFINNGNVGNCSQRV